MRIAILKGFQKEPFHYIAGKTKKRGGPAGVILKNGYIVAKWGDVDRVDMTFSVTKSYLSTICGLAYDAKLIKDLQEPVGQLVWDGTFDGVHVGHSELIKRAQDAAKKVDGDTVAYTFSPHPAQVLAPTKAPPLLSSESRRLELLEAAGATVAVVEPFTKEFAELEPETFFKDILLGIIKAEYIVVGSDFSFGRGGKGRPQDLVKMAREAAIKCDVVEPVLVGGTRASSTRARQAVLVGDLPLAKTILGRPHDVDGVVIHGAHRGRELGFPTANIETKAELLPSTGIYAVRGMDMMASSPTWMLGAASLGKNPTFVDVDGNSDVRLAVYFLDFDGDLYGKTMRIEFIERRRDEKKYDSVDELVAQINRDVENARHAIEKNT